MSSAHFTDEHDAFRREVRRFLESEVAPQAAAWEADRRIPREIFRRMGELGFLGILAPERYGGSGGDPFHALAFLEELPRSRMGGFCAAVSVQQFMATPHILRTGSDDLKERYLKPSIAGRKVGALAITEPDTGSDVASLRTRAEADGAHYVVNGAKTFITNGADGDFYTTAVRTGGPGAAGISLLVIDADTPGVRVAARLEKLGWHASDTAEIVFENARVPTAHLIGGENTGFYQMMEAFELERLCSAAIAVGSGTVALEETLAFMAGRQAFGRTIDRFQALRHRLADLDTELEAARQLTYHAAWLLDQGRPAARETSMAKLLATELGQRIADACLQCFGGYGYMEEYPAARFFRDARGATITAGTSEVMREIVARFLFDDRPRTEAAPGTQERPAPPPPPAAPSAATAVVPDVDPAPEPSAPPTEPAPPADSLEAMIRSLETRLLPERAEGWNSTFHLVVKGAEKPEWTVRIADGRCRVEPGLHDEPNCTVRSREKTFMGIQDGSVNPQTAYLMGRIKVSNLSEMMRFVQAFRSES